MNAIIYLGIGVILGGAITFYETIKEPIDYIKKKLSSS